MKKIDKKRLNSDKEKIVVNLNKKIVYSDEDQTEQSEYIDEEQLDILEQLDESNNRNINEKIYWNDNKSNNIKSLKSAERFELNSIKNKLLHESDNLLVPTIPRPHTSPLALYDGRKNIQKNNTNNQEQRVTSINSPILTSWESRLSMSRNSILSESTTSQNLSGIDNERSSFDETSLSSSMNITLSKGKKKLSHTDGENSINEQLSPSQSSPRVISFGTNSHPLSNIQTIPTSIARKRFLKKSNKLETSTKKLNYNPPNTAPTESKRKGKLKRKSLSDGTQIGEIKDETKKISHHSMIPTMKLIRLNENRSQTSLFGMMKQNPLIIPSKKQLDKFNHSDSTQQFSIIGSSISEDQSSKNTEDKLNILQLKPNESIIPHQPTVEIRTKTKKIEKNKKQEKVENSTNYKFPKQTNLIDLDSTLKKANDHISEIFTYKQYKKSISNYTEGIELPTLGIKLLVEKKEQQYNLLQKNRRIDLVHDNSPEITDLEADDITESRSTMRPWSGFII